MPISEKRLAANKANALRSTGPRSAIGKQNSSRNSSRHRILANAVLVDHEDQGRFADLLNSLHADFNPVDNTERILVEKMAVAHWRTMRTWANESASVKHETRSQAETTVDENPPTRTMLAIRALDKADRHPDAMGLREHRYDREYYRALRALTARQQARSAAENKKSTHEPSQSDENTAPPKTDEPTTDPLEPTVAADEPAPDPVEPTI